ncbi:unnamed protein product [Cylindrotheca closterium]|uniref:Uncharacterized protein n=1 Tax=Cylindrotheca closterium TaxID=2856 RepID=A0AAD2JPC6_9STRA|nr:unnamed protein product [Cylindrotheca closterium]
MSEKMPVQFKPSKEEHPKPKLNQPPSSRRQSSFFKRLSQRFRRSKGERGADVKALRGCHGADFEGYTELSRGVIGYKCGCFQSTDTSSKERFLVVKGAFCFVFKNEMSPSPKYAIRLAHMKANRDTSDEDTVVLKSSLGDIEYTFVFRNPMSAKQFTRVANKQASLGEIEEVKVRLGHGHLLKKSKSVLFAGKVARAKVDDQPEEKEPISTEQIAQMNLNQMAVI